MSDLARQHEFSRLLARFLDVLFVLGYEVTFGEAWRPTWVALEYVKQHLGIANSFHTRRLAVDLNLFRNGVYLTRTEDYLEAGIAWEKLGGTWGGRFKRADGNHFSLGE
jgi:hypothetical protein